MSQQQILLIVLALIVVGIAVAMAVVLFSDNAASANRDAVANDLINFAARVHDHYRRPTHHAGGGGSFAGLSADAEGLAKVTNLPDGKNANGTYRILVSGTGDQVTLEGVGVEILPDGNPVTVRMLIREGGFSDSLYQVY